MTMCILNWLRDLISSKKKFNEIEQQINDQQLVTKQADEALTKLIAALDHEDEWFTCHCIKKECTDGSINHNIS